MSEKERPDKGKELVRWVGGIEPVFEVGEDKISLPMIREVNGEYMISRADLVGITSGIEVEFQGKRYNVKLSGSKFIGQEIPAFPQVSQNTETPIESNIIPGSSGVQTGPLEYEYDCRCGEHRKLSWESPQEFNAMVSSQGGNVIDIHNIKGKEVQHAMIMRLAYEGGGLVARGDPNPLKVDGASLSGAPQPLKVGGTPLSTAFHYDTVKVAGTPVNVIKPERIVVGEFNDEWAAYPSWRMTNKKTKSMYKILNEIVRSLEKGCGPEDRVLHSKSEYHLLTTYSKTLQNLRENKKNTLQKLMEKLKLRKYDPHFARKIFEEFENIKNKFNFDTRGKGGSLYLDYESIKNLRDLFAFQKKAKRVPFSYGGAKASVLVYPYKKKHRIDIIQHSPFTLDALGKLRDMTLTFMDGLEVNNQDIVYPELFMSPKAGEVFDKMLNAKWDAVYSTYATHQKIVPSFEDMNKKIKLYSRIKTGIKWGVRVLYSIMLPWKAAELAVHPEWPADFQNWQNALSYGGSWVTGPEYEALAAAGKAFAFALGGVIGGAIALSVDLSYRYVGGEFLKSRHGWKGRPMKDYAHLCASSWKIDNNPLGEGKLFKSNLHALPTEGPYNPVPVLTTI